MSDCTGHAINPSVVPSRPCVLNVKMLLYSVMVIVTSSQIPDTNPMHAILEDGELFLNNLGGRVISDEDYR